MPIGIRPGDVVRKVSGGPIMTVTRVERRADPAPLASCEWFDARFVACKGSFPLATLTKVSSEVYLNELRIGAD